MLIVFAPDRGDPQYRAQQAALAEARMSLGERDVHVIEVVGDSVAGAHEYAAALRQRYAIPGNRFGVLLIGRDGGVKLRSDVRVDGERLARTIDAMPVRRREMAAR